MPATVGTINDRGTEARIYENELGKDESGLSQREAAETGTQRRCTKLQDRVPEGINQRREATPRDKTAFPGHRSSSSVRQAFLEKILRTGNLFSF